MLRIQKYPVFHEQPIVVYVISEGFGTVERKTSFRKCRLQPFRNGKSRSITLSADLAKEVVHPDLNNLYTNNRILGIFER